MPDAAQHLDAHAARFLAAIREQDVPAAHQVLAEHPGIAATSIHAAAAAADAGAVAGFLERDRALAVAPDGETWPPLVYACWSGVHAISDLLPAASRRVVELLLDHGADPKTSIQPEACDEGPGLSALYGACEANNIVVVRLLLERGADPNDGESVYHGAQKNRRECLDLLLAHGADLSNRHPHWQNTPLYFLAGHTDDEDGSAAWLAGMGWLLEHGADPNVTSGEARETPLHAIVKSSRNLAATTLLLDRGADVHLARADGRTPYTLATRVGNTAAAALLAGRGASTDLGSMDDLLGACMRGDSDTARRIAGAYPDWRDRLAAEDRGAVVAAVWAGHPDAIRLMADLSFDLAWEGDWGGTPLHHAAWLGKPDVARLLLDLGAPVNVRDSRFGSSPIAWAAHGSTNCRKADDDYCAVTTMLLDAGAEYMASINNEHEPPQGFASGRVAELLRTRGFAPGSPA
jgi:ankyrin repeat protein